MLMFVTMKVFSVAILSLVGCLCAPLSASILTYTDQAIASGSLGGTAFTNALVTLTLTGNTSSVTSPSPGIFTLVAPLTVSVAGLGSTSFTDTAQAVDNQSNGLAGFGDNTLNVFILGTGNSVFASYNLSTPIGPDTGSPALNPGASFNTASGAFVITSAGNSTFTASGLSSVPEPSEFAPLVLGLFGLVTLARKRF